MCPFCGFVWFDEHGFCQGCGRHPSELKHFPQERDEGAWDTYMEVEDEQSDNYEG